MPAGGTVPVGTPRGAVRAGRTPAPAAPAPAAATGRMPGQAARSTYDMGTSDETFTEGNEGNEGLRKGQGSVFFVSFVTFCERTRMRP